MQQRLRWLRSGWQLFVRALDRSLFFRITVAFAVACAILAILQGLDELRLNPRNCNMGPLCWRVISIENIEGFGILVVASLYLIESRDRRKRRHYEAWQVIDNAAAANVPTSYARVQAMQDLNEDGVSLGGVDVPGADLEGIRLPGANLREATLSDTDLRSAHLPKANLQAATLTRADCQNANLREANLRAIDGSAANFAATQLQKVDLQAANLAGADFTAACLAGADLSRANIAAANFTDADLREANLLGARVTEGSFKKAIFRGAQMAGAIMPDGTVISQTHSKHASARKTSANFRK